ncbi:MAG TPA: hypothetical protein VHE30_17710 [Polyangiaceae bacterium]|nr:hypothetical protein [Polyangiaceae bacterium]
MGLRVGLWAALAVATFAACGGSVKDDASGGPRPDPAGGGGAPSDADAAVALGSCVLDDPDPTEQGSGLCAPPPPLKRRSSKCACFPITGEPGTESCPPSRATELGGRACCLDGRCAFDFGQGCTADSIENPEGTPLAGCQDASGAPVLVYEGAAEHLGLMDGKIVAVGHDPGVVQVDTRSCAAIPLEPGVFVTQFTSVENEVYYSISGPRGDEVVRERSGATSGTADLVAALGGGDLAVLGLGGDAASTYAIVDQQQGTDSRRIVELPCCNGEVRLVGDLPPSINVVLGQFFVDGPELYIVATVSPTSPNRLHRMNATTGALETVFDALGNGYSPFAVRAGVVYLGAPGGIVAFDVASCSSRTLVEVEKGGVGVPTLHDDTLYWAEASDGLAFFSVYEAPVTGGTPRRLADVDGRVKNIQANATDVYVVSENASGGDRVVRVPR